MQARGGPDPNPHQRSLSVDARARKQQRGAQSSESLALGPAARGSRARSSDRRPRTPVGLAGAFADNSDDEDWRPTMEDDELDSEYRRRSVGDAFYGQGAELRDRSLRNARSKAQSEDHLGESALRRFIRARLCVTKRFHALTFCACRPSRQRP